MRALLLLAIGLVALVTGRKVPVQPLVGYHESVGIALAQRIKEAEDAIYLPVERARDDYTFYNDNRIVGGVIAPANSHPHLAGLLISLIGVAGNSVCGSSLLTSNRLVTAAHCWTDGRFQAWQFTVVLGSQFLFYGGTRIATSQVIMHPQYNSQFLINDVAMIYLPTHVSYSEQTGVTTATQISQVTVQVITFADCLRVFGSSYVHASTLCTSGAGAVGVCGGDSGGPLVSFQNGQRTLIGISSFVAGTGCQLGHPSGFARVTSFISFITQHL